MKMFFGVMGLNFISLKNYQSLEEKVGQKILELTDEILLENLSAEKIESSKKPDFQALERRDLVPVIQKNMPIDSMKGDMLTELLKHYEFPYSMKVAEKKRCLKLLCQNYEELEAEAKSNCQNPPIRIKCGYDGSWLRRSYGCNARSPYGQGCMIGALTKLPVAWGWRVMNCAICSRAENRDSDVIPDHLCAINHFGTIKSMESDIALECANFLLYHGAVLKEITTDGDGSTHTTLQYGLIDSPVQRLYGAKEIISNKADMRHFTKCLKDRIYKISDKVSGVIQKKKVIPMVPKYDAPKLARLVEYVRCQLTDESNAEVKNLNLDEKVDLMTKTISNFNAHYFNDDPSKHRSCKKLKLNKCPVALGDKNATPDLHGGKWLGERCGNIEQTKQLRLELENMWEEVKDPTILKMILREGETQTNEALHSCQTNLCPKNETFGNSMRYVWAMAAGVCKMSIGNSFLVRTAEKLELPLTKLAKNLLGLKDKKRKRDKLHKKKPQTKKKRKIASKNLSAKLHPNEVKLDVCPIKMDYAGRGGGDGGIAAKRK